MKKCLYLFLIFLALFVFNACNNSSHVETAEYNRLVFDTAANNTKIPFPNDLIWQSSNGIVDLTANATDPSSTALYTAIKALNIKGLSPNTPLAIPLFSDKKLDENSFKESIFIFNLNNQSIFSDFEAKQNENVINVYSLKPFDAGSRYAVIITDELKDVDGYPVMPAVIYKTIRDVDNCSALEGDLVNLCNAYNPLWNLGSTITGKLKDEILEVFTFTTADKTLSLNDFGVISATAANNGLIQSYDTLIKGYSYEDLQSDNSSNEFLSVDALTDLPLLCASITDNITDNSTYFKSINLFNLGNIQGILKSYDFPDNQSNYSSVCSAIFDNSSLYTNVTMKRKDTASPDAFLIFQHGLGGSTDALDIIADDFDKYILIGLDLPWHGGRVLSDNNPNTSCYENISGSCYLTDNPIYDRLNIYQSVFDMHILTKMVSLNALNMQKPDALNMQKPVYFLGQSMGSITGSMLLNVDNVSKSNVLLKATSGQKGNNVVSKAVLNVGGGGYAALLNEATNALIKNLVAALNLEKHSIEYYITLGVFQLLLDPVDPAYFADNFAVTNKVILQAANGDTVVPNITNKILANAYNFDSSVYITPETDKTSDMISNPVPGFYVYGKDDNFVNHGFLLSTLISGYPEAEDYLDEDYVENMQGLAITQIKNFFSN